MVAFPQIDPVLVQIGPLQVRWYGLMYVLGFSASYFLVRHQIRKFALRDLGLHFENLNFTLLVCLIVGARLGYVLFYNPAHFVSHPLEIFATWQGGMSFHGGLIALILGGLVFCRSKGLDFWEAADVYTVTTPIGLGFGRLGNFINGELYGRPSDVPWAMIFPGGGPFPRHPSQLYEVLLEGVLLFLLVWPLKDKRWRPGTMLAIFLCAYGMVRTFVEFFREPDPQLGLFLGHISMGQMLSGLMLTTGLALLVLRRQTTVSRQGNA